MTHRVVRSTIVRATGERYEPGDVIEPTDAELQAFGDNLEKETENSEICGAEMSNGSTCDRPADECPYHDTN